MKKLLTFSAALASLLLVACSPYKMEIQQGNVVTQEMLNRIERGMTEERVQFILGTPLVRDPFHPERWDYVYLHRLGGELVEKRRVTLYFNDGKLARIEGDVTAADDSPETDGAAQPAEGPADGSSASQ